MDDEICCYEGISCCFNSNQSVIRFFSESDTKLGHMTVPDGVNPEDLIVACQVWIDAALELDKVSNEDAEAAAKTLA